MALAAMKRRLARLVEPATAVRTLPRTGRCASCGRPSVFLKVGNRRLTQTMRAWPYGREVIAATATRENWFCAWCRRPWRMRQLAAAAWPHVQGADVYEPALRGVLARRLHGAARSYVVSEFLDTATPGQEVGGVQHQDLQRLTFPDMSFDLVLTSEVFEHVEDPWAGFREVRRVLRAGGRHLFTVPAIPGTTTRSRRGLPAVVHGDPTRPEGSFVITDFGDDLPELLAPLGFRTVVSAIPEHAPLLRIYDSVAV